VQNLRRGHYKITVDLPTLDRVRVAFIELALNEDVLGRRASSRSASSNIVHARTACRHDLASVESRFSADGRQCSVCARE
jgi:hypothetical protein